MTAFLWRLVGLTAAAFMIHMISLSTSLGMIRFELPFFLAVLAAVREPNPWKSGFIFFVPSVLYDFLDNQFAGTLSHVILFILIRRFKRVVSLDRFPMSILLCVVMAGIDRLIYGFLVATQLGAGMEITYKLFLDPAYLLTILFLPLAFGRPRRAS